MWQTPNVALLVWLAAIIASRFTHGTAHTIISSLGTTAIIIWAILEIISGASPFRRMLGLVVLLFVAATRFL